MYIYNVYDNVYHVPIIIWARVLLQTHASFNSSHTPAIASMFILFFSGGHDVMIVMTLDDFGSTCTKDVFAITDRAYRVASFQAIRLAAGYPLEMQTWSCSCLCGETHVTTIGHSRAACQTSRKDQTRNPAAVFSSASS